MVDTGIWIHKERWREKLIYVLLLFHLVVHKQYINEWKKIEQQKIKDLPVNGSNIKKKLLLEGEVFEYSLLTFRSALLEIIALIAALLRQACKHAISPSRAK